MVTTQGALYAFRTHSALLCIFPTAIDRWSKLSRLSRLSIYLGILEGAPELFQYLAARLAVNLRRTPSREAEACF